MIKAGSLFYRFRGYILGFLALALFLTRPSPLPSFDVLVDFNLYVFWMAAFLFYSFGFILRVFARRFIGEHSRGKVHDAETLVTGGPYAYMRHPLYTSNFMMACGVIFLHLGASFWAPVFVLVVAVFEIALSRMEDAFLESRFGDEWREWAKDTPAFLAHMARRDKKKHADSPKRSVWCAFKADACTWGWLLIVNFLVLLLKLQ